MVRPRWQTPSADSATVAEDGTLTLPSTDLTANDSAGPGEDDQKLSVTAVGNATNGSVDLDENGDITFTPAADYSGPASFEYTVCDDGQTDGTDDPKCTTGTVEVTVTAVNDAPSANGDSKTVAEDDVLVFDPTVDDSPGPPTESAQSLTVDEIITTGPNAGKVRYTPDADYSGEDSFEYRICDDGQTNGADDPKCATAKVIIRERACANRVARRISSGHHRAVLPHGVMATPPAHAFCNPGLSVAVYEPSA